MDFHQLYPEDSIRYSIKYHIKQPDNLIYILNKEDFSGMDPSQMAHS